MVSSGRIENQPITGFHDPQSTTRPSNMADENTKNVGKSNFKPETKEDHKISIKSSSKESDVSFLSSVGQKVSGTVEEIHERAELFKKQPELANRLARDVKERKRNDRLFGRELAWEDVPVPQERWAMGPFPSFTREQLMQYASPKLPGRKSMLEKGQRFFNSRKVILFNRLFL